MLTWIRFCWNCLSILHHFYKQTLNNQSTKRHEGKMELIRVIIRLKFEFFFFFSQCLIAVTKACLGEEKEREKAVEEACELLKFLEEELEEKRFFGGESIGMVDIVANVIAFWLGIFEEVSGVELLTTQKFPKLCNWAHEFVSNGVIKENLPPRDKLIAHFRNPEVIAYLRNRSGLADASK